ncbi:MAG: prepilin-type N-terminal cleavage/methylation domain-containing protein [Elusimicrobia bacterium]|nr:prepilin-type N-terminal cleavage/methylation domain-containing protein [Elusimicrobiota bacterium]
MRRRARVARRGYTLVETMIAVLLVSVVVTSVFSMVLTARTGVNKSGKKGQAVFYLREVVEALKTYVTADLTAPGPNSWQLPGDTCGCWALQAGAHNATGYLPTSFTGAPTSGQLTYDVIDMACGAATCKQVTFNLTWNE